MAFIFIFHDHHQQTSSVTPTLLRHVNGAHLNVSTIDIKLGETDEVMVGHVPVLHLQNCRPAQPQGHDNTEHRNAFLFQSSKRSVKGRCRLQALAYHLLPPTTAITGYAIGLRKL